MRSLSKKGLTLVEVVVALSILTVVFAGTVTLIVHVVKLSVISGKKTEITTWAQEGISTQIQNTGQGCTGVTLPSPIVNTTTDGYTLTVDKPVRVNYNDSFDPASGGDPWVRDDTNGNFFKFVAHVDGPLTYNLTQVIKVR